MKYYLYWSTHNERKTTSITSGSSFSDLLFIISVEKHGTWLKYSNFSWSVSSPVPGHWSSVTLSIQLKLSNFLEI